MSQIGLNKAWNCISKSKCQCNPSEPFAVVKTVDDYREYWHPNYSSWIGSGKSLKKEKEGDHPKGGVMVLLLAESHVCTSAQAHSIKFLPNSIVSMPHKGYPNNYVSFIYNIGYGEPSLYTPVPLTQSGSNFWILFAICSRAGYNSRTNYSSKVPNRIQNKVALLLELQQRGIWLLDASVNGKGVKHSSKNYDDFIKCSWCNTTANRIVAENPQHIVIIGKDIRNALSRIVCGSKSPPFQNSKFVGPHKIERGTLLGIPTTVINQPQSRIPGKWDPKSKSQRGVEVKELHDICKKFAP